MFPEEGLMMMQAHTKPCDYEEAARGERAASCEFLSLLSLAKRSKGNLCEILGIIIWFACPNIHTHTHTHKHTSTHTTVSNATGQFYIYSAIKRMMCFTCNLLAWKSKFKIPLYETI